MFIGIVEVMILICIAIGVTLMFMKKVKTGLIVALGGSILSMVIYALVDFLIILNQRGSI